MSAAHEPVNDLDSGDKPMSKIVEVGSPLGIPPERERSQLEKDFHRKAMSATNIILEDLKSEGIYPEIKKIRNERGKDVWPADIHNFVLRNLKQRARMDLRNVQQARNDLHHAERVSNLLFGTLRQEGETEENRSKKRQYDNFVVLERTEFPDNSKPVKKIEIHYGALETKADREFSKGLLDDVAAFIEDETDIKLKKHQNVEIKVVFHYPNGDDPDQEVLSPLQARMIETGRTYYTSDDSNREKVLFLVETRQLPFRADTLKALDKKIDIKKRTLGRHPLEKYRAVEISEVNEVIEKVISGLPESSNLRGLMESNKKVFISELSKKVTQYKTGDLEETSGYIFEIASMLEIAQQSSLHARIEDVLNFSRMGSDKLNFDHPEMVRVNVAYASQMSKTARSHGEAVVIRNYASNPANDDNRIIAVIECKSSSKEEAITYNIDQLRAQKEELSYFVRYFNKWKKGKKLSSLPPHLINSIVIKPRMDNDNNAEPVKVYRRTNDMISVIRSEMVTDTDMDIVKEVITEHHRSKNSKQSDENHQ